MTKTELLIRLASFALEAQKTDSVDFLRLLKKIEGDWKHGTGNCKSNYRVINRAVDFRMHAEQRLGVQGRSLPRE